MSTVRSVTSVAALLPASATPLLSDGNCAGWPLWPLPLIVRLPYCVDGPLTNTVPAPPWLAPFPPEASRLFSIVPVAVAYVIAMAPPPPSRSPAPPCASTEPLPPRVVVWIHTDPPAPPSKPPVPPSARITPSLVTVAAAIVTTPPPGQQRLAPPPASCG